MAADVSVPNTFSNGTTADAPEVNDNFAAIVAWINTNAVHLDASKAFTAIPTGPATDPTTANQLTRKSYVDAKIWADANFTNNTISGLKITDGTLTGTKLVDGTIAASKIGDTQVTQAKIADLAVINAKLGGSSVTADKIMDATITGAKIAADTITTANISPGNFADIKNTKLADYCGRATMTGNQSIPNDTFTTINFDAADTFDYGNMHDPAVFNHIVQAPVAGVWHWDAHVIFDDSVAGTRYIRIVRYTSGGVFQEMVAQTAVDAGDYSGVFNAAFLTLHCGGVTAMNAGDWCQVEVYQSSSAALDAIDNFVTATISWHCVRLN